jgi:hypothetical protein
MSGVGYHVSRYHCDNPWQSMEGRCSSGHCEFLLTIQLWEFPHRKVRLIKNIQFISPTNSCLVCLSPTSPIEVRRIASSGSSP